MDVRGDLFWYPKHKGGREKGLLLNGSFFQVKGFCQHMDHAGTGIAVPDKLMEYRLHKMKELGANALRCSP